MPTTLPARITPHRHPRRPELWIVVLLLAIASGQAIAVSDTVAALAPTLEEIAGP